MLTIVSGVGLLLVTLAGFSLFSLKMPKGQLAMSGMANAAIATFLVEAVHKYITGDLLGLDFFRTVGSTSGSLGGVAAAIMVPISMGTSPVLAVVAGVAVGGYGILPGFIAGYVIGLIAPVIEKRLPEGLNIIGGALLIAPMARLIALAADPAVNVILARIGGTIAAATEQSPIVMGFLLGGIIKMICTSPLSSMALTAMLGLDGLEQGAPLGRRLQEAMNAQIRALTKGDITKEREVLSMDTWRALAELDAQAKEYEELKKQYGK